jgi:hypothetical protein
MGPVPGYKQSVQRNISLFLMARRNSSMMLMRTQAASSIIQNSTLNSKSSRKSISLTKNSANAWVWALLDLGTGETDGNPHKSSAADT